MITLEELRQRGEEIKNQCFPTLRAIPIEIGVPTELERGKYDPKRGIFGSIVIDETWLTTEPTEIALSNVLKHEHVHAELYIEGDRQHRSHVGKWQIRMREVGATEGHILAAYLASVLELNKDKIDRGGISDEAWSKMQMMCEIAIALQSEEENSCQANTAQI